MGDTGQLRVSPILIFIRLCSLVRIVVFRLLLVWRRTVWGNLVSTVVWLVVVRILSVLLTRLLTLIVWRWLLILIRCVRLICSCVGMLVVVVLWWMRCVPWLTCGVTCRPVRWVVRVVTWRIRVGLICVRICWLLIVFRRMMGKLLVCVLRGLVGIGLLICMGMCVLCRSLFVCLCFLWVTVCLSCRVRLRLRWALSFSGLIRILCRVRLLSVVFCCGLRLCPSGLMRGWLAMVVRWFGDCGGCFVYGLLWFRVWRWLLFCFGFLFSCV